MEVWFRVDHAKLNPDLFPFYDSGYSIDLFLRMKNSRWKQIKLDKKSDYIIAVH